MNEQLQKALAEIIQKTMTGLDTAVSFLSGELPDVIHQLLMWYAIKNGIYFLIGLAWILIYFVIVTWGFRNARDYENSEGYHDGEAYFVWAIPSSIVGLISIPIVGSLINLEWLQIIVAPKIWLIEYAARLVK